MKIYDYANRAVEVDRQGKEIDRIHVTVMSGDEIVTVYFQDGTKIRKDSCECRIKDFYWGEYNVNKHDLKKWEEFEFGEEVMKSWQRMSAFDSCQSND